MLIAILSHPAVGKCADPSVQLRINWGSGDAQAEHLWHGNISVDQGTLSLVRPLGIEADEPGSMWLENGRIEIRPRSTRRDDGVDVLVSAPQNAVLSIELSDAQQHDAAASVSKFALSELLERPQSKIVGKQGDRIQVRRAPGDLLRVVPHRENLVFSPGETFQFDVEPRLLPVAAGTALQLRTRLISAGGGNELGTQEQNIKTTAQETTPSSTVWRFKLPDKEGVYDLAIEALEPASLRWNKAKLVAERHVQVIVVDNKAPVALPDAGTPWARIMEIDPANPSWYERVKSWSILPGVVQGPFGFGDLQIWQHPSLGSAVQISPSTGGAEPHWEAYPLTVSHPGAPHILEVEYPNEITQTLGISVVEPNAAGVISAIGIDSGFYAVEELSPPGAKMLKHRIVFWPRTKTPLVLLTNRRDGSRAVFSKIRVLAGPSKLPRAFATTDVPERLLAGYLNRPLAPENFGAVETLDIVSGRSLKDWQTLYQGASRLVEYLDHVGYGGQMLTVMADGSAIYPSDLIEPTSRYDNGVHFELGQDPVRKDGLELTLRLFDRDGLKLIPALQFAAPLPELEARLRTGGDDATGIQLIGPEGTPYFDKHPSFPGAAPYYNPLNEHVQEAMLAVVRELVQRYKAHPSFAGLAIEMSADGFAQMPGEMWGLDDATIARFQRDTGITVPANGEARFAQRAQFFGDTSHPNQREAWLRWRADVLAKFYRQIRDELISARRDAVLYLAATNLFDSPDAQRRMRPTLPPSAHVDEVLLSLGIRASVLREEQGLMLLRPQRLQPPGPIAVQAVDMELNRAADFDTLVRGQPSAGALFFHEPQRARLAAFDAKSPYGKDKTNLSLVAELSPSDRRNRQRFVHALAAIDPVAMFDGGWLLPLGQEESVADFVAAYRRLPAGKFESVTDQTLPVTIRKLATHSGTFAYLVNDSDWPVTVQMKLDMPPGCRMEELTGRRRIPAPDGQSWTISLEPFDLVALRFAASDVQLSEAKLVTDEKLKSALDRNVQNLRQRLVALSARQPVQMLTNANFELPAKGSQIPNWSLVNPAAGEAIIDADSAPLPSGKQAGKQSVRLTSKGAVVSLHSDAFSAPTTGRLSVLMWLRVDDPTNQPPLRLAIEGIYDDKPYYVFAPVGLGQQQGQQIQPAWSQFLLQLDDLPPTGLDKLRVRFDLMGPGRVWIDDVQLYDLYFNSEIESAQLKKIVALADIELQSGKLGDCLHELEGYWPRFLNAYVPLTQESIVNQAPTPPAGNPPPQAPPGNPPTKQASRPASPADWLKWKW